MIRSPLHSWKSWLHRREPSFLKKPLQPSRLKTPISILNLFHLPTSRQRQSSLPCSRPDRMSISVKSVITPSQPSSMQVFWRTSVLKLMHGAQRTSSLKQLSSQVHPWVTQPTSFLSTFTSRASWSERISSQRRVSLSPRHSMSSTQHVLRLLIPQRASTHSQSEVRELPVRPLISWCFLRLPTSMRKTSTSPRTASSTSTPKAVRRLCTTTSSSSRRVLLPMQSTGVMQSRSTASSAAQHRSFSRIPMQSAA